MSQTLGKSPGSTTPIVVSQKGHRTTGSPLLDSFLPTPESKNTAYLSDALSKQRATDTIDWRSRQPASRPSASGVEKLPSLGSATPLAAPTKSEAIAQAVVERTATERPVIEKAIAEKPVIKNATVEQTILEKTAVEKTETKADATKLADAATSKNKRPRKRGLNPSLEKAAAVGMLDLSDKLLFGGEDDELISAYLGGEDPLVTEEDETVVLKYLSKQIAESTLTQIKSRLPLAPQPASEIERSKIVLDAKNFKVAQRAIALADREDAGQISETQPGDDPPELDIEAINQQINQLNQKVASLTKELSDLTTSVPEQNKPRSQPGAGEAA